MKTYKQIKIALTLMAILSFAGMIHAQNSWEPISSTLPSDYILVIRFNGQGDMFAAGAKLYRSSDSGQSWDTIITGIPEIFGVSAIGIAPNGNIFIGTLSIGEGRYSNGIYRSTDNGETWLNCKSDMVSIADIKISNSGVIFVAASGAASSGGLYRSADDGASWQQLASYATGQLVIDSTHNRLYASFYTSTDSKSNWGVYASTDGGSSWNIMNNGFVNDNGSISIGINAQGHVFAGTFSNGIFRSTDGGEHWSSINNGIASGNKSPPGNFVFTATGGLLYNSFGNAIHYSDDNGDTWGRVSRGLPDSCVIRNVLPSGNSILVSWVKGLSGQDILNPSLARRSEFSTSSRPPRQHSPVNNSREVDVSPLLSWNAASLESTYRVLIYRVNNGTYQIILDSAAILDTSLQLFNLEKATTYYWLVDAKNVEGESGWSSGAAFTTKFPLLTAPELLSPSHGATNINPRIINLNWSRIISVAYEVQIARDSTFSSLVFMDTIVEWPYFYVVFMEINTTYYWRVRYTRNDSLGEWSLPWKFTTGEPVEAHQNVDDAVPDRFYVHVNNPIVLQTGVGIDFGIPFEAVVSLKLFDLTGRKLSSPIEEQMAPGRYKKVLQREGLSRGTYLLKLQAGTFIHTEIITFLK